MNIHMTMDFSPEKICRRRGLGSAHGARKALAHSARARMDKYVPYDTGALKGSAAISPGSAEITYSQPYARAQFYLPYHHDDPRRGPRWHSRMLAAEGAGLLGDVAAVIGGEPK